MSEERKEKEPGVILKRTLEKAGMWALCAHYLTELQKEFIFPFDRKGIKSQERLKKLSRFIEVRI